MIGGAALLFALGLGSAVTLVADFDIPYFLNNPQIHEETLRRCHQDYRLAMTPECENAEAAGTRRIGRPLPPLTEKKKPAAPSIPIPKPRGIDRGT